MKISQSALAAVILSTISCVSLAAQNADDLATVQQPSATSYVTGSTTLVSLDVQLSGRSTAAEPSVQAVRTVALADSNGLNGATIRFH